MTFHTTVHEVYIGDTTPVRVSLILGSCVGETPNCDRTVVLGRTGETKTKRIMTVDVSHLYKQLLIRQIMVIMVVVSLQRLLMDTLPVLVTHCATKELMEVSIENFKGNYGRDVSLLHVINFGFYCRRVS